MTERRDFKNWSREDIVKQINWLSTCSKLTVFTSDKAFAIGDGEFRIAEFKEDKTWSDWATHDAPNLHVTEGKFVFNDDSESSMPIIRISTVEAIEICSTEAKPWTDNDAANVFNYGMGSTYLSSIAKGRLQRIELLTTRPTLPGVLFQIDIYGKMEQYLYHNGSKEERAKKADVPYQSDEWVKYYPYNEKNEFWVPIQEIVYLKSLLKKIDRKAAKKAQKELLKESRKKSTEIVESSDESENSINHSAKNYKIAALLAIVFGGWGAHKFYMGKYLAGIIYLAFCWTWIPSIIGVLEGLCILLRGQEKFESKLK